MSWQVGGTFFVLAVRLEQEIKNLKMREYLSLKLKWCEWLCNGIIKSLFLSSFPLVCLLLYVKNMVIHTVSPHNPLIFPLSFPKLVFLIPCCVWMDFSFFLRRNFLKCLSCPINYSVLLQIFKWNMLPYFKFSPNILLCGKTHQTLRHFMRPCKVNIFGTFYVINGRRLNVLSSSGQSERPRGDRLFFWSGCSNSLGWVWCSGAAQDAH